ncbi:Hsp70 family protein [Actinomadura violacea]|uniref:Hsp70 family protein n=1 Tax=Actinomadura violacea TaxID=2819934 RepID=UPI0027DDF507|nr:Hsp70 family protein [Actinomadura violacea]
MPRGVPQIEVTLDVDANGNIGVLARDLGTGVERSAAVTVGSALPEDDIEQMAREARWYAEQSRRRKEEAEETVAEVKRNLEHTDTESVRTSAEKLARLGRKLRTVVQARRVQPGRPR